MAGAIRVMSEACHYLHDTLSRLPRLKREDLAHIPQNGFYVLFENGEQGRFGVRSSEHLLDNDSRRRMVSSL